jgi:hypothetical protein
MWPKIKDRYRVCMSTITCTIYFSGGDVMGEATREAPVRAEPHPTCAGLAKLAVPN